MMKRFSFKCCPYIVSAVYLLQIFIFVLCLVSISRHIAVHADSSAASEQKEECYISIQVRYGESLWEISRRYYSSEYKSMNLYIKKIMNLNHMSDEKINAGAYLIIPYYNHASYISDLADCDLAE